jgi:hypothetical protein
MTAPIVTLSQATEALKVAYQIIDCFKKINKFEFKKVKRRRLLKLNIH